MTAVLPGARTSMSRTAAPENDKSLIRPLCEAPPRSLGGWRTSQKVLVLGSIITSPSWASTVVDRLGCQCKLITQPFMIGRATAGLMGDQCWSADDLLRGDDQFSARG
jgi:hypothetical protein